MKALLFTVFSVFLVAQAQAREVCRLQEAPNYSVHLEAAEGRRYSLILLKGGAIVAQGAARAIPTHVGSQYVAVAEETGRKMIYSTSFTDSGNFSYEGIIRATCASQELN